MIVVILKSARYNIVLYNFLSLIYNSIFAFYLFFSDFLSILNNSVFFSFLAYGLLKKKKIVITLEFAIYKSKAALNGGNTVSSTNGPGKTGQLPVKE